LNFGAGASYVNQKVGEDSNKDYMALHLSERFDRALTKTSKIWEEIDYYPAFTRFSNYLVDAEAGAEAALNARLSLRVVVDDHFNSEPGEGNKENDILLASLLAYKY
jgi:putative salt-induced outer membrane protein YdiY